MDIQNELLISANKLELVMLKRRNRNVRSWMERRIKSLVAWYICHKFIQRADKLSVQRTALLELLDDCLSED